MRTGWRCQWCELSKLGDSLTGQTALNRRDVVNVQKILFETSIDVCLSTNVCHVALQSVLKACFMTCKEMST